MLYTEQDIEREGFVELSHLKASAAEPLAVLQSTVRFRVPFELQVDVEQVLHLEACHFSHMGVAHVIDVEGLVPTSHCDAGTVNMTGHPSLDIPG